MKGVKGVKVVKIGAAATALALGLGACRHGRGDDLERPRPVDGPGLVFDDVRVFDGERDLGITDVWVQGETIVHVGEVELPEAPVEGLEIVAGRGRTLLPGLIDAHVHVHSLLDLQRAIAFGVTTELDQFMDEAKLGSIRERQARGKLLDHADLRSAGSCATPPGGHGIEYGVEIPTIPVAASVDEVDAWMADRVAAGVDWVKIIYDDGHAVGRPFAIFDEPTLAAIIEAAHAAELRTVVHVSDRNAASTAIALGADGLAHGFIDAEADPAFVELARSHDAFVADTLAVWHVACADPRVLDELADERLLELAEPGRAWQVRASMRAAGAAGLDCRDLDRSVRAFVDAGIDVLASTDAPNFGLQHGAALHVELALLVAAGLSPTEALTAATSAPARRFGLDDRGRIAAGLRADLLLVAGDPTEDVRDARAIVGVWKAGEALDLDRHREGIAERRSAIRSARLAAPPAGADVDPFSTFDDGELAASFGAGWSPSTDQLIGGTSTVELAVDPSGGHASPGALHVTGEVVPDDGGRPWSGATFSTGAEPGQPATLGRARGMHVWLRGTPGRYALMFFAAHRGAMPAVEFVEVGEAWARVEVSFEALDLDARDLIQVFVGAVEPGRFELWIDDPGLEFGLPPDH